MKINKVILILCVGVLTAALIALTLINSSKLPLSEKTSPSQTTENIIQEKTPLTEMTTAPTIFPDSGDYPADPDEVVTNFYSWYFSCINNHFWRAANEANYSPSPNDTCNYKESRYLTPELITKVSTNIGGDSILCAQNTPLKISVEDAAMNGNTATVTVHTYYSETEDNPIAVTLEQRDTQWKIIDITCK